MTTPREVLDRLNELTAVTPPSKAEALELIVAIGSALPERKANGYDPKAEMRSYYCRVRDAQSIGRVWAVIYGELVGHAETLIAPMQPSKPGRSPFGYSAMEVEE